MTFDKDMTCSQCGREINVDYVARRVKIDGDVWCIDCVRNRPDWQHTETKRGIIRYYAGPEFYRIGSTFKEFMPTDVKSYMTSLDMIAERYGPIEKIVYHPVPDFVWTVFALVGESPREHYTVSAGGQLFYVYQPSKDELAKMEAIGIETEECPELGFETAPEDSIPRYGFSVKVKPDVTVKEFSNAVIYLQMHDILPVMDSLEFCRDTIYFDMQHEDGITEEEIAGYFDDVGQVLERIVYEKEERDIDGSRRGADGGDRDGAEGHEEGDRADDSDARLRRRGRHVHYGAFRAHRMGRHGLVGRLCCSCGMGVSHGSPVVHEKVWVNVLDSRI